MRRLVTLLLVLGSANLAAAETVSASRFTFGGFVDGYYAYNFNDPDDGANFVPGTGTSAKRANEFSVNLAQIDLTLSPDPVGFRLAVGFGNSVDVVHAAEVDEPGTSSDLWRYVTQASVVYKTHVGRGLAFEGGIFPSHVGFESLASKDNWNYTRSWLGEFSPYYQTGLKVSYPFTDAWSAQFHVLNGWQIIGENNSAKTFGTQVAYNHDKVSAAFNTLAGPELPDNDDDWRLFGDVVLTVRLTTAWSIGASVDAARQSNSAGADAEWWGGAGYARWSPPDSRMAFALRGEYFSDPDGAISGTAQRLREGTATFEYRPVERLILKFEGRYDVSSATVFGTDRMDAGGAPELAKRQTMVVVGAVVTF